MLLDNNGQTGTYAGWWGTTPLSTADLTTISGGTLAINRGGFGSLDWPLTSGSLSLSSLTLDATSILTHPSCTTTSCSKIDISVPGNLKIDGTIDVSGSGYLANNKKGPDGVTNAGNGRTNGNVPGVSGNYLPGAHGGGPVIKNANGVIITNTAYDSFSNPALPGGAGNDYGSNGGGVVFLTTGGNLELNGVIKANGGTASTPSSNDPGGAGGTVNLNVVGNLTSTSGTPAIYARGSKGGSNVGSDGHGGRIAIRYGSLGGAFTWLPTGPTVIPSNISAAGGTGGNASRGTLGQPGTIYFKQTADTYGSLFVTNDGNPADATYMLELNSESGNAIHLKDLLLYGNARVKQMSTNDLMSVDGKIKIAAGSALLIPDDGDGAQLGHWSSMFSGTKTWFAHTASGQDSYTVGTSLIEYPPGTTISNFTINSGNVASFTAIPWTIKPGEVITIDLNSQISISSLNMTGNAKLTHRGCSVAAGCTRVDLNIAGNATIGSNASINADGLGYLGGLNGDNAGTAGYTYNPGNPAFGTTTGGANVWWQGGSHGGYGEYVWYAGPSTAVYGDFRGPIEWGGGSHSDPAPAIGGNGGGVIRLLVSGTLTVDGAITATGQDMTIPPAGRTSRETGAGGSVWLQATTLTTTTGTPLISAMGGKGVDVGSGGGGRVAIYTKNTPTFTLAPPLVTATAVMRSYASHGTIYIATGASIDPMQIDFTQGDTKTLLIDGANTLDLNYSYGSPTPLNISTGATITLNKLIVTRKAWARQDANTYNVGVTGTLDLTGGRMDVPNYGTMNDGTFGAWFNATGATLTGVTTGAAGTLREY